MSLKRFVAPSAREAMAAVRRELGDDAIVLANRKVDDGVEITAMAADQIDVVMERTRQVASTRPAAAPAQPAVVRSGGLVAPPPAVDAAGHEAGTETFESFIRRGAKPVPESSTAVFLQRRAEREREAAAEAARAMAAPAIPAIAAAPAPAAEPVYAAPAAAVAGPSDHRLFEEIRSMKAMLSEQLAAFAWIDTVRRHPLQARLAGEVLGAGFSPALSRSLVETLPEECGDDEARKWLAAEIARNLPVSGEGNFLDQGGVFAIVGPTGVGKTTTTAKLAARYAMRYGARNVGLITTDSYRIGAHDQLKIYGRILGIQVELARGGTLVSLVDSMRDKKVVLIDTVGVSQRDSRVPDLMAELTETGAKKVLVLNAAAQGENLDEVARVYQRFGIDGAIMSKIDEAARLGGALDCALRHQLMLLFVTNGQRVPEDLHPAHANFLVHRAFRASASPAYELKDSEQGILFSRAVHDARDTVASHAA